jgi:hypothetical protein
MTLRAKFVCTELTEYTYDKAVKLITQYSNTPEDNQFSSVTPNGTLSMMLSSDAGKIFFKPGKKYFIDITEEQD